MVYNFILDYSFKTIYVVVAIVMREIALGGEVNIELTFSTIPVDIVSIMPKRVVSSVELLTDDAEFKLSSLSLMALQILKFEMYLGSGG